MSELTSLDILIVIYVLHGADHEVSIYAHDCLHKFLVIYLHHAPKLFIGFVKILLY